MTYVYFMEDLDSGEIKIGRSWNPLERAKQVAYTSKRRVRVIAAATVWSPSLFESSLHRLLKEARQGHEWFRSTADVRRCIDACWFPPQRDPDDRKELTEALRTLYAGRTVLTPEPQDRMPRVYAAYAFGCEVVS